MMKHGADGDAKWRDRVRYKNGNCAGDFLQFQSANNYLLIW